MDWGAVGAVAEVVGAVAVVASLMYLASQVQTSNRLARAEAWRASNRDLNSLNAAFGTDPVFRSGLTRVIDEGAVRSELTVDERRAVSLYLISVANIYEQLFREVQEGVLSEAALEFGGRDLFETPFFRTSWPFLKPNLGASFVKHFEAWFNLSDISGEVAEADAL